MAEDPLDEMNEDLDDSMGDILDDDFMDDSIGDSKDTVLEDSVQDAKDGKKGSFIKKISGKLQPLYKKIFQSKKILIIMAVSFVCLLLIGIGGLVFVFSGGDELSENSGVPVQAGSSQNSVRIVEEIAYEDIVELEPFERVPLKNSSSLGAISINIALELVDKEERKQIYPLEEQIRQIVMDQMAKMTWLELRNPEGKIMLKYNLLKQINSLFPKTTVRNVYFTYFVMQ